VTDKADQDKLAELILYIAKQSEADRRFGKVKLIKLLAYADFEAYLRIGRSITGSRYQRLPHGPAPREAPATLDQLINRGELEETHRVLGSFRQTRYVARRRPNVAAFNPQELEIVNEVLFRFARAGGKQISEASHRDFAGWAMVADHEDIPYHTALLSTEPPSDEALARGREILDRLAASGN
jgi:Protein of unknown function (DUF4065)